MAVLPDKLFHSTRFRNGEPAKATFKYRPAATYLFIIYLLFLIVPWIVTCILMVRPALKSSYHNQAGDYTQRDVQQMERWRTGIDVINRVAATIAVPTVSSLLAQAAVIFLQRRERNQELELSQMLTLADRGWLDLATVGEMLVPSNPDRKFRTRSNFLLLATLLVLFSLTITMRGTAAILSPLQSILVKYETIRLVTCSDVPATSARSPCEANQYRTTEIGFDPTPRGLEACPQNPVVHQTMEKLTSVSKKDIQSQLWIDDPIAMYSPTFGSFNYLFSYLGDINLPYFAAAFSNGTSTGVLRQHAARIDTSVKCALVDEREFPTSCPGERPFETRFSLMGLTSKVCAEGRFDETPWTRTRDKQEITERLWLHQKDEISNSTMESARRPQNFTMKCDAVSRRGWFELGNHYNGFRYGPLLDTWPKDDELRAGFNDYRHNSNGLSTYFDSSEDTAPSIELNLTDSNEGYSIGDDSGFLVPGPLMTTALALFGNASTFGVAQDIKEEDAVRALPQLCRQFRVPLNRVLRPNIFACGRALGQSTNDQSQSIDLAFAVGQLFNIFSLSNNTQEALNMGAFFANEALLNTVASAGSAYSAVGYSTLESRIIYSSQGYNLIKPRWALSSIVAISVLIGIEIILLSLVLRYIYSVPTWSKFIDAQALLRIGIQLGREKENADIAHSSGLVGLASPSDVENIEDEPGKDRRSEEAEPSGAIPLQEKQPIKLALGGPGLITRDVLK